MKSIAYWAMHGTGNSRNGYYAKTVKSSAGDVAVQIPQDRNGEFEPQFSEKGQTRLSQFDNQIRICFARGISTRNIAAMFEEMFGVMVSHNEISKVTDAVREQIQSWQTRPLDEVYPIVYLDCIVVKVHRDKRVIKKAISWPWALVWRVKKNYWVCGSQKMKELNSGCLSSPNLAMGCKRYSYRLRGWINRSYRGRFSQNNDAVIHYAHGSPFTQNYLMERP